MRITEEMLRPVREGFADADGSLAVGLVNDQYNWVVHDVPPLLDPSVPEAVWKKYVLEVGFRPTGPNNFTSTHDLITDWDGWSREGSEQVALLLAFLDRMPPLSPEVEWIALDHVCNGVSLDHLRMIACRLTLTAAARELFERIADHWFLSYLTSDIDRVRTDYKDKVRANVAQYRHQLMEFGLDWTGTRPILKEAVYPIDLRQDFLDRIAVDSPRLASLIPSDLQGIDDLRSPTLIVIAENSD